MKTFLTKAKQIWTYISKMDVCSNATPKKEFQRPILKIKKTSEDQFKNEDKKQKKITWTPYECALLIYTLEQVKEGNINRKEAIKKLSIELRHIGKEEGYNIDMLYRNEHGIALQMLKMEFLLTDGNEGLSGASKTFVQVSNIYKEDILLFNQKFNLNTKGLFISSNKTIILNTSKKEE